MNFKRVFWYCLTVFMLLSMTVGSVLAEDGDLYRRNISKTPDNETEKSAVYMMDFYVPAQDSTGLVAPVDDYLLADETTEGYEARNYAKPLISAWIDDLTPVDTKGGITFGQFDAFVGVSLDDGDSWKTENLSRSSDLSSFTLQTGYAYPGDVHNVVHQVAEDKILAVWASKYCQSGFPLYSLSTENNIADNQSYLADLETNWGKNALYLYDFFGVAGDQGSVDYEEQGYPEIGEIPYSCIWTARGKLLPGDDPMTADFVEASHVVWTAPERLTSGVRDANLPAVDCAGGAGCALTWQEDPEGLRPGKGLGPGEGWSGAVVNAKTDIWYSYISFADFDLVDFDGDTSTPDATLIEDYEIAMGTDMDRPKPYVPMAIPVRLTDNDMCKAVAGSNANPEDPFCWTDFDTIDDLDNTNIVQFFMDLTAPEDGADFCATTADWTNPGGTTLPICVAEDGRWMIGRVGSSRVRMAIKPYTPLEAPDHDGDGTPDKSAWLSLAAEESKALGVTGDLDGDGVADVEPVDIGKDMFYYSFDYAKPYNLHVNTALDAVDDSAYFVQQGGMLNQPAQCSPYFITTADTNPDATCPEDGAFFDIQTDPITGYEYYLTEIARRFALMLNNPSNIVKLDNGVVVPADNNESGLSGMLIYKQGIIFQGGPADIMLRRVVIPDGFDPATDNPYAYENMDCTNPDGTSGWVYPADNTGTFTINPNYLKGVCMAPAINISGTTIKTCTESSVEEDCVSAFPVADDGTIPDDITFDNFPKVLEWRQCDADGTSLSGEEPFTCFDNDLDDQSWENPFDVAKGHRGFLYGDMVLAMYAWSPNWQANSVGNDHYNLYVRRSFDGGLTWTTTPTEFEGAGLIAVDYNYGDTIGEFIPIHYDYAAGEFEQARNLSLLHGNKITVLDPRYSPAGGLKQYSTIRTDWLTANSDLLPSFDDVLPYPDDAAIDPSKFYVVYETGDNTTVATGEAIPLNLYYSRATEYGDNYEWYDYINDDADCNPDPDTGEIDWATCVEPRFPWLENDQEILSGEASVVLNPGGTFAYNVWNQWQEEIIITVDEYGIEHEEDLVFDSDIIFRRLLWLPDDSIVEPLNLPPVATILATSQVVYGTEEVEDQIISLYASARDLDKINDETLEPIQEYIWTINDVPIPVEYQEAYKEAGLDCFSGKECNAPARVLSENWDGREWSDPGGAGWSAQSYKGWVQFALQVKDNDDPAKYSKIYIVKKYISQYNADLPLYFTFLPLTSK